MAAWQERAHCVGSGVDFFDKTNKAPALSLCAVCPVKRECLQLALDGEGDAPARRRYGIFGGTTGDERARIHRGTVRRVRSA